MIPTRLGSFGPKLNALTGPRRTFLSFRINTHRDTDIFPFSPNDSPFSFKNRLVDFDPRADASCALLPTFDCGNAQIIIGVFDDFRKCRHWPAIVAAFVSNAEIKNRRLAQAPPHLQQGMLDEFDGSCDPPCISAAPAALDRYPRGFAGHVAHPIAPFASASAGRRSLAVCCPCLTKSCRVLTFNLS